MSTTIAITGEVRGRAGKGTARRTRSAGRIPAIIYGNRETPVLISLDARGMGRHVRSTGFFTHLFDVAVDGTVHRVLPRDVQFDPVTDAPLHIDFLRVVEGTTITVEIPVEFVDGDKSPGLKRGGVLNVVRHTIDMVCRADAIPTQITVSLEGFDINDSIHISQIKLPEGAVPTITDRDFTVATIASPSAMRSEAAEAAAAAAATPVVETPEPTT